MELVALANRTTTSCCFAELRAPSSTAATRNQQSLLLTGGGRRVAAVPSAGRCNASLWLTLCKDPAATGLALSTLCAVVTKVRILSNYLEGSSDMDRHCHLLL